MSLFLRFIYPVFLLHFCNHQPYRLFDNEHERLVWIQDSCGCSGERNGLAMQVLMRAQKMSRADVENELGLPVKRVYDSGEAEMEAYYPINSHCDSMHQMNYYYADDLRENKRTLVTSTIERTGYYIIPTYNSDGTI